MVNFVKVQDRVRVEGAAHREVVLENRLSLPERLGAFIVYGVGGAEVEHLLAEEGQV
jgi:hypothetical protein